MSRREDSYHWALLSGPNNHLKSDLQLTMYHVKDKLVIKGEPKAASSVWEYSVESDRSSLLLAHIVVGKIRDIHRLEDILRSVPVRSSKEGWNSISWVQEAFRLVSVAPGVLGSHIEDWEEIRRTAMSYVDEKKAKHRFDGLGRFDLSKPATWDMLQGKEVAV
ncbi:uncharacterized protein MAM_03148 [Metarhizium album ARSEF 1941]|uniref:Uncharacterized protein n=1 Tax=Metarhizium album (strain ARSEF 1941) TaxID=1081103 RepID=A0A0B2WRK0_METAS|nr:uncharacterized protein MAM_03148 [Metarhizium album ARSEF 1941]KHN98686.1 hypothetical protein MAM_03148 [Metarhizium album ARSEF 1941]